MSLYLKRALRNITSEKTISVITVVTIALCILVVSAFMLFFLNTAEIMNYWKRGVRVMVYLAAETSDDQLADIKDRLLELEGVRTARFISKSDALAQLKTQLRRQASLFENLRENPLPDAFEVRLADTLRQQAAIEKTAAAIEALPAVEEVEYGRQWMKRFAEIYNLFKLIGYALAMLFFLATAFIVANTIRLVLYGRQEEIEIMRLVGATDRFIKIPFFLQGMVQGLLGGIIGLGVLFGAYGFLQSNVEQGAFGGLLTPRFLPPGSWLAILAGGILAAWLGAWVSLRQFLKT